MNNTTRREDDHELLRQINQLEVKLRLANETIDEKVRKLESLGNGKDSFAPQLDATKSELRATQVELERMKANEARLQSTVESRVSIQWPADTNEEPTNYRVQLT